MYLLHEEMRIEHSGQVIEITDELASHYYVLRGQQRVAIDHGTLTALLGALRPAEEYGEGLAGVLEMLTFLEADGVVLASWLRVLPQNYADLLSCSTLLYLWRAGAEYDECAGVVPRWCEELSKKYMAKELDLTPIQSHKYALYLCYLVDCQQQLVDLKVELADVLPLTIHTCNTNDTPTRLLALLEEGARTSYPKRVERIWLRLRESTDFTVSSCSTLVLSRLRELFYDSMILAILQNNISDRGAEAAMRHNPKDLHWRIGEALRHSEFLCEYAKWDSYAIDNAAHYVKKSVRLW